MSISTLVQELNEIISTESLALSDLLKGFSLSDEVEILLKSDDLHYDGQIGLNRLLLSEVYPQYIKAPYWFKQFTNIFRDGPTAAPYTAVILVDKGSQNPLNVHARKAEKIAVTLGQYDDRIQFTEGTYDEDLTVYAGAGRDEFHVQNDFVQNDFAASDKMVTLYGEEGDDVAVIDYGAGVPNGAVRLAFDGGPQDRVRSLDTTEAEKALAIARNENSLPADVQFAFVFDGKEISVTVEARAFDNADQLRGYIQEAVDSAMLAANVTWAGDVAVVLAQSGALKFALSHRGDMLRVVGDGTTPGGQYRPSNTTGGGGVVTIGGNEFTLSGVEPLVVHGLPDFHVTTPDDDANLTVGTMAVADLNLGNLVLQTITVDGVVTWTAL